jgi:hypothetical protein
MAAFWVWARLRVGRNGGNGQDHRCAGDGSTHFPWHEVLLTGCSRRRVAGVLRGAGFSPGRPLRGESKARPACSFALALAEADALFGDSSPLPASLRLRLDAKLAVKRDVVRTASD